MKRQVVLPLALLLIAAACQPRAIGLARTAYGPTPSRESRQSPLGPYDVVELPLGGIPEPEPHAIFHPEFVDPASGAYVQVLRVIPDPRPIPLERWLYAHLPGEGPTAHPEAGELRPRFEDGGYSALAVYVRVRAPGGRSAMDPFYPSLDSSGGVLGAWPPLEVFEGHGGLPCAPPVDSSQPQAYPPPLPRYEPQTQLLAPGESREGWLLCLSPETDSGASWLTWLDRSHAGEAEGRITAWRAVERPLAGTWHLLPAGTVLAWNDLEAKAPEAPSADPAPPFPEGALASPSIPEATSGFVYQSPVWISVGMGMSSFEGLGGSGGGRTKLHEYEPSLTYDGCDAIGAWFSLQEPPGIRCQPWEERRYGGFFLQFSVPGMEDVRGNWDHLALADDFKVEIYLDEDLDGRIATFDGVHIFSEFTWLRTPIPAGVDTLWLTFERSGGAVAEAALPVWAVQLLDDAPEPTTAEELCGSLECLNLSESNLDRPDNRALAIDGLVPLLPMNQAASGIQIRDIWAARGEIPLNDNLHGQDFIPTKRRDPWLLIEIAAITERAGELQLLYPRGDGIFALEPLDLIALYRGDSGQIAARHGVHVASRVASEGIALMGTLPIDVSLDDAVLILPRTGPAWQLAAARDAVPSEETPPTEPDIPASPQPARPALGPPEMPIGERLSRAFPGFADGPSGRLGGPDSGDWPAMRHLGDSANIAGKTFTVRRAKIVTGELYPIAYEPRTGMRRSAPDGLRTDPFHFGDNSEVFIPPNASLIMVQIDVDPEAIELPSGRAGCQTPGERDFGDMLRLSYPGYGEIPPLRTSSDEDFGEYASPTLYCLSSGWLYFHVGSLDIHPDELWFEIVDDANDEFAVWTLSPFP